jgi:kumamolisin
MTTRQDRLAIPGSNRPAVPEATLVGRSEPGQGIRVSIYARPNPHQTGKLKPWIDKLNAELPKDRKYMSPDECNKAYGADPADLKKIIDWAHACRLKVVSSSETSRRVLVEGTVADMDAAFGIQLNEYDHPKTGHYRGREGQIFVPSDLYGVIESVEGLDTRPVGHARCRRGHGLPVSWQSLKAKGATHSKGQAQVTLADLSDHWPGVFFPPQVANLYDYPKNLTGSGQNVAIFAFNGSSGNPDGGYNLDSLKKYFEQVLGGSTPSISDVVVQGKGNRPGPETEASGKQGDSTDEVMLDMCVLGSVAPGAKIFMYFTEFTTQGWVDALHQAVMDDNDISVISISYGNPEDDPQGAWTPMGINLVNQVFEAAAAKGITICCASGDDGSLDDEGSGAHADYPASSPFVLGVGGTRLVANNESNPTAIADETVWNELLQGGGAGGGGISSVFSKPSYQDGVNVPPSADPPHRIGRGVPDVAALADPQTGVAIMHVNGQHLDPVGGTSASAPLWAALIARLNQGLQARCGFLNTLLYTRFSKGVLRDITVGNNGAYEAGPGWDACTGLGSPQGAQLLAALSGRSTSVRTQTRKTKK